MKKLSLLIGPVLFLVGQLLWPGGSADNAQRVELIRQNAAMWVLSHQIFVLAFAFLMLWLIQVYNAAQTRASHLAGIGALFTGFALLADFAIAIEQILSVALVTSPLGSQAASIIGAWRSDPNFGLLVLLPYVLGFLVGLPLLGIGLWRSGHSPLVAGCMALTGLLLVAAGVLGIKMVFIAAAVALMAGSAVLAFATPLARVDRPVAPVTA